ncbi:saposin [Monoraphidium neglectum]|uniref:Saposin n=1 Tax=Monoraphidium neglectum TaxID=145388 RepID=A0A0D2MKB6_9CHLO|nr:saposin [Monoraphidium neglectum]KIY95360.1 saposin [Monoraphidium neglectum]|eukprot:XP_013894380.1 saposin [Monoraphidium neglectum]
MKWICVLLACLAVAEASRGGPVSNDLCSECTWAVRALKDLMCDPGVEGNVVDWVIDNVCAAAGDNKQSCADIVNGIAPALLDWLRLGTDAQEMCAEAGVCGAPPPAFAAPAKPRRARAAPRNDLTCPLCMFVVSKVKETLSDPITRQAVHDKTRAACGVMPEGAVRDACIQWADQYGGTLGLTRRGTE